MSLKWDVIVRVIGFLSAIALIFCTVFKVINKTEATDWIIFIASIVTLFGFGKEVVNNIKNNPKK